MTDGPNLDRNLDLVDPSVPRCPLGVDVPWPLDERLHRLVNLVADEKLGPTSKHELAAALICSADASGLAMWDQVLRMRRTSVGEAAFWVPSDEQVVALAARMPGRRPRR